MKIEPDEQAVICQDCNSFCFSRHRPPGGEAMVARACPYACDEDGNQTIGVGEQRYGRS